MKKVFLILITLICFYGTALAHPGVGIVMDSKGNVFYTDLVHVWKIGADGSHGIAVEDVHTHELYLDEDDNLYGEHVWYNGEAVDTWSYYVWCLSSSGALEQVVPPTEGFPENNTLVRNKNAATFWPASQGEYEILMKKDLNGKITRYSDHMFTDIRWLHIPRKSEDVFVVDHLGIKRVSKHGEVEILAEYMRERGRAFGNVRDMHYLMGMWLAEDKALYVAVYGAKKVVKIDQEGTTTAVYESPPFWSPCGVLVAPDGSLWIMEFSSRNRARVKKINANGSEVTFQE